VQLLNNFNQLIVHGNNQKIKILSIIEGQKMAFLGKKVVERESAVCGLDKKYEEEILLDHDHRQICKPQYIKDRRYTHFAHFVAKTIQIPQNKTDDEKKADDDNGNVVIFIDPNNDSSDDLKAALNEYNKHQNFASLTTLMGTLLKDRTKSYAEHKLKELLKGNLMKQNTKILNALLKTREFMKHVDESKIRESIELSNEYWRLLKVSKQIITNKKTQINKLLTASKRWKKILEKRIKYENDEGPAPSKLDGNYMKYVEKQLCAYFSAGSEDTEQMAAKWANLTEKMAEQHSWWQEKYEWFKDFKQKQWEKMKQKAQSFWGCVDMVGGVLKWIGAAVTVCAAVVAVICAAPVALIVCGVAATASLVAYGSQKFAKSRQKQLVKETRHASVVEKSVKKVMDAFNTMKKDGSIMDKLFSDFGRLLCAPKEHAKEIEDEAKNEGDEVNWYMMNDNVEEIITSLDDLKGVCADLIDQVDKSQKNFYAE